MRGKMGGVECQSEKAGSGQRAWAGPRTLLIMPVMTSIALQIRDPDLRGKQMKISSEMERFGMD